MPQTSTKERAGPSEGRSSRLPPVRILFLAWGYSIHAVRRIRIFTEDPEFEVAVASPHDYRFPGARNVLLTGKAERSEIAGRFTRERDAIRNRASRSGRWVGRLTEKGGDLRRLLPGLFRIGVVHHGTIRAALGSQNVLLEAEIAQRDFTILESAVREFRPDVIFLQTLLYPCYLALSLPKRIPLMITFWNGDVTWWAQWSGTERLFKKWIVAHGVRRARVVTVNSESARAACLSYGTHPERVHIVRYPGVDRRLFHPSSRREARERLGIGAWRVVLCPRGLGGYLNSDMVVEAVPAVLARYPDVLFLLLYRPGVEDEMERLQQRAEELGIGDRLRWEGQVPWESMPAYYNAADVMVSISSHDSLPNSMLEAMACGVPVIMGDIPSIREWIADGVNGFLVPPRDPQSLSEAIIKVFEAPEGVLETITRKGMKRVIQETDGETNARRIKALVCRVAGASSGGI